jgi:hypothetical protein
VTYEVPSDDSIVHFTVVEEKREVVADSSSYYDGRGAAESEEEKQKVFEDIDYDGNMSAF